MSTEASMPKQPNVMANVAEVRVSAAVRSCPSLPIPAAKGYAHIQLFPSSCLNF